MANLVGASGGFCSGEFFYFIQSYIVDESTHSNGVITVFFKRHPVILSCLDAVSQHLHNLTNICHVAFSNIVNIGVDGDKTPQDYKIVHLLWTTVLLVHLVLYSPNHQDARPSISRNYKLLNCDDYHDLCKKKLKRDPKEFRPDICHQELLALLDSPLNKSDHLQVYIRTSQNVLIELHPSV